MSIFSPEDGVDMNSSMLLSFACWGKGSRQFVSWLSWKAVDVVVVEDAVAVVVVIVEEEEDMAQ
eukprot:13486756-Ditylum_brightwellii.AAC.1